MKQPQISKKEMEKIHVAIPNAYEQLEQGRISRREFMRFATLLGMSASVAAIAAACGGGGAADEPAADSGDSGDTAVDSGGSTDSGSETAVSGTAIGGVQPLSTRANVLSTISLSALGVLAPRARMPLTGDKVTESPFTLTPCLLVTLSSLAAFNMPGTYSSKTRWKLVPPKP